MNRLSIGEALAARLYAAESAIDQALIETATLAAALPAARAEAWLPAVTGQGAFAGTAGAILVWAALYSQLIPFSDWAVSLLPVDPRSHLGQSLALQFGRHHICVSKFLRRR